jgi:crossover junction endodeoxyribonuclease RuvC
LKFWTAKFSSEGAWSRVLSLLASIIFKSDADHTFVESVNARPGEGPTGAFAFGRARGVIEGALAAAGVPVTFIMPPAWKRTLGLTLASKDASRAEAIRRWPGHAELFARVRDDGRAEAALIAVAGIMRKGGAP